MEFPKVNFGDEEACFETLFKWIHPEGFCCPRCHAGQEFLHIHHADKRPWHVKRRCQRCRRVFNARTKTLKGTQRPPSEILRIMKADVEHIPDAHVARKLKRHRGTLAKLRHKLELLTSRFMEEPPDA